MENVYKKKAVKAIHQLLSDLGLVVRIVVANASAFGAPSSRTRLFAIGVDVSQVKLTFEPAQWMKFNCKQNQTARMVCSCKG